MPVVLDMIRLGPELPAWKFTAFRQRRVESVGIKIDDLKLTAEDIYFKAYEHDGGLAIDLIVKDVETDEHLKTMSMILMDTIIGEYDAITKITAVGFVNPKKKKLSKRQA